MHRCCEGGILVRPYSIFLTGLCFLLATSLPVRAQQSSGAPLTDAQKDGRRIFQQRCAVCHTLPTVVSKRYGPALYKEIVEDNEDNIRDTILEGREGLMPGFKYGLTRAEIDSIIEYLKTVSRPARPKNNPNQKEGTPGSAGE
jgi:mono/diheme cytochrome c family protein